jgi:hypothetical protein
MSKQKRKPVPPSLQAWIEARGRHHLSHAHVQMARELGMNPKKLGSIDNHTGAGEEKEGEEGEEDGRARGSREIHTPIGCRGTPLEYDTQKECQRDWQFVGFLEGSDVAASSPWIPYRRSCHYLDTAQRHLGSISPWAPSKRRSDALCRSATTRAKV